MGQKIETYHRAPQIAYRELQLVDPAERATYHGLVLNLGTFRIIDSEPATTAVVEALIDEFANLIEEFLADYKPRYDAADSAKRSQLGTQIQQFQRELNDRLVLTYADFLRFVGHEKSERKDNYPGLLNDGARSVRSTARYKFAVLQQSRNFSHDYSGYRQYLRLANAKFYNTLDTDLPALVPDEPRQEHTYILSTTKTGKTELIKALCLNYAENPEHAGVVVLDPGGDMAPQMSRWMEPIIRQRLVYIDPVLSEFNVPVINPFDADHLNDKERTLLTDQIVAAIGSLVEGRLGGTLSVPMEAALYPSVRLLLDLPNTSLLDLQALMLNDERLIEAGCASANPAIAKFFKEQFTSLTNLRSSKDAIVTRLGNILTKGILGKVLCGRTTINLERLLAERKFIVVNLAKGRISAAESSALGTLLVSMIQAIAMKRVDLKDADRPLTHLIIDECQNFLTDHMKTIIRETRKFGLAVTLAQQEFCGDMGADLAGVVTKTTNVKVVGRSALAETKSTGTLVGIPPENIASLPAGQYYWKNGTAPTFLLRVRSDLLKFRHSIDNDTWLKAMNHQQQLYYRSIDGKEPVAVTSKQPTGPEPSPQPQIFE